MAGTHIVARPVVCLAFWIACGVMLYGHLGCSRQAYRLAADRDAEELILSRMTDPAWTLPTRSVEPDARSRFGLIADPDFEPKPLDDPGAHQWMNRPYRFDNSRYWEKLPTSGELENPGWLEHLPTNAEGRLQISQELAIDLALLHNRQFQTGLEQVYLRALALSGNRFEFDTQWHGGIGADFTATGDGSSRLLTVSDRLGAGRNLAAGGQFATNLLNGFVFEFGSGNFQQASGTVVATFTQPLLRGAFRHVRLENLTQAERQLLYEVRDFARFRRQFYLEVTSRYYSLLAQVQSIRNQRANLESLELNLREHQELFDIQTVSQIQVDQVFQDYQSGRIAVFSAEQSLETSIDAFKFLLGLPAWIEIEIDQSPLDAFEFSSAEILDLESRTQSLYSELVGFLPDRHPTAAQLREYFQRYKQIRQEMVRLMPSVRQELRDWFLRLERQTMGPLDTNDQADLSQQFRLAQQIRQRMDLLESGLEDHVRGQLLEQAILAYEPPDPELDDPSGAAAAESAWRRLLTVVGREAREQVNELYSAQSQIRLFALDVEEVAVDPRLAVEYALENRLDLMNSRARVMDAYRLVEVSANALRSQLDLDAGAILRTDPGKQNPLGFTKSEHTYQVGVQFDGPLNRFQERNAYRASQLFYQQARRQLIADQDGVANTVRANLRELQISRLNLQIARQQYVAANRQVDEAKFNLRNASRADSNLTRDLLTALQVLLSAKNNLISNWVDFQVQKIRLFTDLELLYLDEEGKWINPDTGLQPVSQPNPIANPDLPPVP